MADTTIKFLSYTGLQQYDELLKQHISDAVSTGISTSFKAVAISDDFELLFYLETPIDMDNLPTPAYTVELPFAEYQKLVASATEGNLASLDANGQVVDSGIAMSTIATKSEVETVTKDLNALKTLVGTIPETATATDIVGYVQEKTAGIATSENLAELTQRVATAEGEIDAIQADYLTSEDEIFETDILTVNALGGIAANADLNGMTTHEIFRKLLYPYVAQVVGTPSRTPNSTVLEKGNDQTITAVSVTVTKKSEAITSVALYNGSTLLEEKTGEEVAAGGTFTFSGLSVEVPSSSVVLTVKVTDASGNVVSKNTAGWNFVYPYYVGVCAEDATIDEALVEGLTKKIEVKGNKSISYTCDNQRCVFAYPKSHGALKSILDPNSFESLSSFTQHEVSITGLDETAQTYYVYVNGASTVTDFSFTFKY